ncbi:MAG: hypothetical protein ACW9W3_09845 [Candidatus Nitrosopumilus sp. bin_68KS]
MGNCFSCNKRMIGFLSYGSRKDVLRNGYQPPNEMKNSDKLCKSCLLEIKHNQTQGRTYNNSVNMIGQMILTVFAPGLSALRIEKWWRFAGISFLLDIAIIGSAITIGAMTENSFFYVLALIFYFVSPFDFYFIHKWTKEWNENAI